MKNKGFTLVEILAVITIVAVLILILVPSVDAIIKAGKDDTYEIQTDLIKSGLKDWAAANAFSLPAAEGENVTITLGELKTGGFVPIEIRNPKTNECFSNDIVLKVTKQNNKYKYDIDNNTITFFESDTCEVE